MIRPKTLDDLRTATETERDALVAAAALPHLPDDECLAVVRPVDERPYPKDNRDSIDEFKRRVPCVGGASNLRRVYTDTKTAKTGDVIVTPTPHGVGYYSVGEDQFRFLEPADVQYDFDDTDQATLSDFGVTTSPIDYVHRRLRHDADPAYDREPVFPV